jgi:hypothetical protein
VLAPAPETFLDPRTSAPRYGAFAGSLPPVQLGRLGIRDRIARRKRWVYAAMTTDELWLSMVIVRTGYAATAFAFLYDRAGKRMLFDESALGPAPFAHVTDDFHAAGMLAKFGMGKTRLTIDRRASTLALRIRMRGLDVDAVIDERSGAPGITAIAPLGGTLLNATEKRALLAVTGEVRCGQRVMALAGGVAGYDYTHGLLPRHTKWRWGFALGKAESGEKFGFNVVEGFVGEAECAAFLGDEVVPIREPRFELDADAPLRPWRLVGDGMDLSFEPGGVHAQTTNLVFVKSRFIQPVGTFTGTVRVRDRAVRVASLAGVVEDQDVLW